MNTLFTLMAEYETVTIPLKRVCHLFGLTEKEAERRANLHRLPVPAYRAGSQKSPWLVDAAALADHLDRAKAKAAADWDRLQGSVGDRRH